MHSNSNTILSSIFDANDRSMRSLKGNKIPKSRKDSKITSVTMRLDYALKFKHHSEFNI